MLNEEQLATNKTRATGSKKGVILRLSVAKSKDLRFSPMSSDFGQGERSAQNPFEKYLGALPAFASVAEINAWLSEMRDDGE